MSLSVVASSSADEGVSSTDAEGVSSSKEDGSLADVAEGAVGVEESTQREVSGRHCSALRHGAYSCLGRSVP